MKVASSRRPSQHVPLAFVVHDQTSCACFDARRVDVGGEILMNSRDVVGCLAHLLHGVIGFRADVGVGKIGITIRPMRS